MDIVDIIFAKVGGFLFRYAEPLAIWIYGGLFFGLLNKRYWGDITCPTWLKFILWPGATFSKMMIRYSPRDYCVKKKSWFYATLMGVFWPLRVAVILLEIVFIGLIICGRILIGWIRFYVGTMVLVFTAHERMVDDDIKKITGP